MLGLELGAGLFKDPKPINEAAEALSPTTGWLFLVGALAVVGYFILHSDRWRRFWLEREDPRSIGLYRILFGTFVLVNMNDFYEYFTFLFTDEGIFTADVARHVHARGQFAGFGDGFTEEEPWGFFDLRAFWEFAKGHKYSLLYFWDSPTAFRIHLWAFYLSSVSFIVGFRTRLAGILTFFLMNSIFFRNHLFWEGTELVYRVFLAYLICAKSGYAYSVDNWRRCKRLRAKGLLSEPGGPGGGAGVAPSAEHPKGLEAIYRQIPAWPRRLMIVQFGFLYASTGILKNGGVWAKGDAIYYAWNMDHFYRFYPQQITALLGTNLLRLATWFTHWGEAFFAVVTLSIFYWWRKSQGFAAPTGGRKWAIRGCLATVLGVAAALIWVTWPVHFAPNFFPKGVDPTGIKSRWIFVGGFVVILVGLYALWQRMGKRPLFSVSKLPIIGKFKTPAKIDQDWAMKWLFGRRIWVPWHLSVMGGIFVLMNIGHFQTAMLSNTVFLFTGLEIARFGKILKGKVFPWLAGKTLLPRVVWTVEGLLFGALVAFAVPRSLAIFGFAAGVAVIVGLRLWLMSKSGKWLRTEGPFIPAEDLTLPHHKRDTLVFPRWAMVATAAILLVGVLVKVRGVTEANLQKAEINTGTDKEEAKAMFNQTAIEMGERWNYIWIGGFLFAAGVAFQRWRAASSTGGPERAKSDEASPTPDEDVAADGAEDSLPGLATADVPEDGNADDEQARDGAGEDEADATETGDAPYRPVPADRPQTGALLPPWAYGPFGRFVAGSVLIWHLTAVPTWLLPAKDSLRTWRAPARKVFAKWLTLTQTDQGWGMFAPNPPRSNVFLKVKVYDQDDEEWDMRTDVYAPERKPIPWIWNDRMRKMNRRIIGGESGNTEWYRKWYARWHCRQWALDHGGDAPKKVELIKYWYKIPSPEQTFPFKWYRPEDLIERTGHEEVKHTEHCKRTVMGQLPNWIRERHGLPPLPEDTPYKPWIKHKQKSWAKKLAKERGEDPKAVKDDKADAETKRDRARKERRDKAKKRRTTARAPKPADSSSLAAVRARADALEAKAAAGD